MIWARIETSSAETGSLQMTIVGSRISARYPHRVNWIMKTTA